MDSPTKTQTVLGRPCALSDKTTAILEYNDQLGGNVFSYADPTYTKGTFTASPDGNTSNIDGQYMRAPTGVEITNSTAMSGCQAVFHFQANNADQIYVNSNYAYWRKLPQPVSSTQETQPFIINDTTLEIQVTNTTNIYVQIKIYDYMYRKDTPAAGSLFDLWQNGLFKASKTAQTCYIFTNKVTPYDSQLFCQFIKVMKTHSVFLGPGATHTHLHKSWLKKTVYPSRFTISTGFLGGLTSGSLFTVIGQPVEATSGSAGAVTTGIVDLNVVAKLKTTLGQNYNNKVVYNPQTATSFYQANQTTGAFKAMIDNSRVWSTEIEGG